MSVVTYNGVQLPYPLTSNFSQDSVYEDSQTDRILTKFDISVQCIIHSAYAAQLAPSLAATPGLGPAQLMNAIRQLLLAQRQRLSFKVGGVEMIPSPPSGNKGTTDAKNGPQPQSCNITNLTDSTFLLTYHIIAHYWEGSSITLSSKGSLTTPPATLSNRWEETVDIDENNLSSRTRTGKVIIRSDNPQALTADQVRNTMAVVGVPQGFLRKSSHYTVDPSGLALAYNVVDQEVFMLPPPEAFTASGKLHVSTTAGAAKYFLSCSVTLTSEKTQFQAPLAASALTIALAKILTQQVGCLVAMFFKLMFSQAASMDISLWSNQVTVSVTAMATKSTARVNGEAAAVGAGAGAAGGAGAGAGVTPPSTVDGITEGMVDAFAGVDFGPPDRCGQYDSTPAYTLRGTANILLQAAAYYDPSIPGVAVDNVGVTATNIDIPQLPALPQTDTIISQPTTISQLNQGKLVGTAGKIAG